MEPHCVGNGSIALTWMGGGGGEDGGISIHPSIIESDPLALVFFRGRKPLPNRNFYGGWSRAVLVMLI